MPIKLFEDKDTINLVFELVVQDLKQKDWPSHKLGISDIALIMKDEDEFPDAMLWDSKERIQEELDFITEQAIKRLKDLGVTKLRSTPKLPPKEVSLSSWGQSYASASQVANIAKQLRKIIWKKEEAPFTSDEKGNTSAIKWLNEQSEKAKRSRKSEGEYTLTLELELTGKVDELKDLNDIGQLDIQSSLKPPTSALSFHDFNLKLSEVMDEQNKLKRVRVKGKYEGYATPILKFSTLTKEVLAFQTYDSSLLLSIHRIVLSLCTLTGWWKEEEALEYLLCDRIPLAGINTKFQNKLNLAADKSLGAHEQPKASSSKITSKTIKRKIENSEGDLLASNLVPEITFEIRGPTTPKELMEAYEQILKKQGLKPKRLSKVHEKVLQLVYETPELSWMQRYEQWLSLCDQDETLPKYKSHNPNASKAALHKEFKRALDRASWNKKRKSFLEETLGITGSLTLADVKEERFNLNNVNLDDKQRQMVEDVYQYTLRQNRGENKG